MVLGTFLLSNMVTQGHVNLKVNIEIQRMTYISLARVIGCCKAERTVADIDVFS